MKNTKDNCTSIVFLHQVIPKEILSKNLVIPNSDFQARWNSTNFGFALYAVFTCMFTHASLNHYFPFSLQNRKKWEWLKAFPSAVN